MKRKLGVFLMALGLVLLAGAAGLLLWNQQEADHAAAASAELMPKLSAAIVKHTQTELTEDTAIPHFPAETENPVMKEVLIDGRNYIGYLSIPGIGLELPVISDWSYANLKIAPCRFSGTTMGEDLVLVAHNYKKHFGPIHRIKLGEQVIFVDMENVTTLYEVVATDVVVPTAVEEVTAGSYDLALVTCTYGGKTRLVVYCDIYDPKE